MKEEKENDLEKFAGQTLFWTSEMGRGVYEISREHVAKTFRENRLEISYCGDGSLDSYQTELFIPEAVDEFEILKKAYGSGLQVPKPEGLYGVCLKNEYIEFNGVPALVMQKIPGCHICDITDPEEIDEAYRQFENQINIAEEKGFIPRDNRYDKNILWDNNKKKTYIIDLQDWSYIGQ